MKVKIGNKIYDSNEELIIIYLTSRDKSNITNMTEEAHYYASYPDDGFLDAEEIHSTMLDFKIQVEANFMSS
jgi:hypothetical protein